ncbi:RidA family protein [Anaerobacillus sp. MEB173]|uniref:RidA family protein n=1 Tax=Anaerobacillus sp. MEB173 TaxID=3383345 RepID=UPI003F907497
MIVEDIEKKAEQLSLNIPVLPKQSGNYLSAKRVGNILYISGITCKWGGEVQYKGQLGGTLTLEEGYDAAKICALNHLAVIKSEVGDLNKVRNIIKMVGYVSCTPDFEDVPKVVNGASDLLIELFGERGKHARCAVGVAALPGGAAVEADLVVELSE